jgi:hypothetical protein
LINEKRIQVLNARMYFDKYEQLRINKVKRYEIAQERLIYKIAKLILDDLDLEKLIKQIPIYFRCNGTETTTGNEEFTMSCCLIDEKYVLELLKKAEYYDAHHNDYNTNQATEKKHGDIRTQKFYKESETE